MLYDSGEVHLRYSRYMAQDGTRWVRHGLFVAYSRSGRVVSEGQYEHGHEEGLWRDFHESGAIAAQGTYRRGLKDGEWRFWLSNGQLEEVVTYVNGQEVTTGSA